MEKVLQSVTITRPKNEIESERERPDLSLLLPRGGWMFVLYKHNTWIDS